MAANCPTPLVEALSRRTATRATDGAILLEKLQPFSADAKFKQSEAAWRCHPDETGW